MWPDGFGKSSSDFMNDVNRLAAFISPYDVRRFTKMEEEIEEPEEPLDINKYFKVVYQTDPIGERGIVLKLTSFDMEAYERDKNRKTIPTEEVSYFIEEDRNYIDYPDTMRYYFMDKITNIVDTHYKGEIEKLKSYIETHRQVATVTEKKIIKGNITNSDNIVCDVIEGNVVNCDNVKVREIRGNTVNCDIRKEG